MSQPKLKIYGERNTGTNYLRELIVLNIDVTLIPGEVPAFINRLLEAKYFPDHEFFRDLYFSMSFHRNLGWKHMLVETPCRLKRFNICSENLFFVALTKNPYSWLLSLFRNPYHQYWKHKPDFEEFIASPWRCVRREHGPRQFSSPVEMWNQKNAAYICLQTSLPTMTIKYEDLISDPEAIIKKLSEEFALRRKQHQFVNLLNSTKDDGKGFYFYRKYYLEETWREKLTPQSIEIINQQLAPDVMRHFNYDFIC